MASGRKAEAPTALQDLHVIDLSYSLDNLASLSTSQLLCVSVHPQASDEQIRRAADELQKRREAQTTRDEGAVHERRHKEQQLELDNQEWMNKGSFRFGVQVGKPSAGYFYEEPPVVRPRKSILSCCWAATSVSRGDADSTASRRPSNLISRLLQPEKLARPSAPISRLPQPRPPPRPPPNPSPPPSLGIEPLLREIISRTQLLRDLDFSAYQPYLTNAPITPRWSFSFYSSIVSFLLACASREQWSSVPSRAAAGIFSRTTFSPVVLRMMEQQPDREQLRRLGLGRLEGPLPDGHDLAKWLAVKMAMEWIWGPNAVSWSEVRWMLVESRLGLFGILKQLGDTHRFQRGVGAAWDDLRSFLRSIPSDRRTSHEQRALILVDFLSVSESRRVLFFTNRDGTTRDEPWREWFEEGEDHERTWVDLVQREKAEIAERDDRWAK
ncbi:hypothetical protein BCR35DRAFT_314365 [Leucosporidium creatinivorum]|uniref:Proteophosphoglycan ppg4 n=1 Tax=Leucosporidium creatinivorum TaxID=106004 RepID=A0A1Y2F070_9BASI|nr:hypothetical protein BCR35DRAFT_314365 [Leucosporidium creatinivorum]